VALLVGMATVALFVSTAGSIASRRSSPVAFAGNRSAAVVPAGDLVAISIRGRVLVLNRAGRQLRELPGRIGADGRSQWIQLAPDRRHAWVSVWNIATETYRIYDVDLATGKRRRMADGLSPTLSPGGTELAYVGYARLRDGYDGESKLIIQDLADGRSRVIPFGAAEPIGNPPQLVVSWSPDGTHVAVDAGERYRLVDARQTTRAISYRALPGTLLAPVYLNANTIVAEANCCIGSQELVKLDVRAGRESNFARISSPVQTVQSVAPGTLLISDALNQLISVSRSRVRILRQGIVAVSP
jgi:hypothetical protein